MNKPAASTFAPAATLRPSPPMTPMGSAALEVHWARHADEVAAAQRLRHQVFAEEMGARLHPPPGTPAGLDADHFDPYCEHLLVRTVGTADAPPQVVGTYRVLTPGAARRAGGLYIDDAFDLARLHALRPRLAELGRACVAAGWRQGTAILRLWGSLAVFMQRNGLDCMIGCASLGMRDGGHAAASLWRQLAPTHLVPQNEQIRPRLPLPLQALRLDTPAEPPPLVRGYLQCGASLLGAPAWDPDFGVADLPMMLRMHDLPPAYRRRWLGADAAAAAAQPG